MANCVCLMCAIAEFVCVKYLIEDCAYLMCLIADFLCACVRPRRANDDVVQETGKRAFCFPPL